MEPMPASALHVQRSDQSWRVQQPCDDHANRTSKRVTDQQSPPLGQGSDGQQVAGSRRQIDACGITVAPRMAAANSTAFLSEESRHQAMTGHRRAVVVATKKLGVKTWR